MAVRYAAEVLAAAGTTSSGWIRFLRLLELAGFVVVSADMRGHGKSSGDAGFVASADQLISDGDKSVLK